MMHDGKMILFDFHCAEKTGEEDLQLAVTRNYFSSLLFFHFGH